ncbi:MAG: hypothetical protein Q4B60_06965 [Erysipelotrichaceae bacterium]|nr:hypothetical protein [Erysipelotrichaceae bacterium]
MKKLLNILLVLLILIAFAGCSKKEQSNIEVNGQSVTVEDFLIDSLKTYMSTEQFALRVKNFKEVTENEESKDFTVTKAIELKANDGDKELHFLLVKADWEYYIEDFGIAAEISIVVNYDDPSMIYDSFEVNELSTAEEGSDAYWCYLLMNGPFVGMDYTNGTLVNNDETRVEMSKDSIKRINEALYK